MLMCFFVVISFFLQLNFVIFMGRTFSRNLIIFERFHAGKMSKLFDPFRVRPVGALPERTFSRDGSQHSRRTDMEPDGSK